ncbi:MAG TPA: S-layer homology domain-containing protein [Candidatus Limnocylindria bacterium]
MTLRPMASALLRGGLGLILLATFVVALPSRQAPVQAGSEAIPDLAMKQLSDFQIQTVNGRRMLRFTAMMVNIGDGHFEVRGSRGSTSQPMEVRQVIYQTSDRNSPISRQILTDAYGKWSGDGHNHWHVQEMMRYDMWGGSGSFRGAKVGFCFLDSDPYNLALPNAAGSSYYRGSWCQTTPSALNNRMGISVGWGDEYEWYLAWQWVDITGLPGGTYTIRSKVDPYSFFLEENEGNNCTWARVSFGSTGSAVTLLERQSTCINDWSTSKFAPDIAWAYDEGITTGCKIDLFCPTSVVTRGQMATFIVRAFNLPATGSDYFTDDEGSTHESSINRLRAAGITVGCSATRFCPDGVVTRGQMATFLTRALDLPATGTDHFTDDDGNTHESSINRIAQAGISHGCGGTLFCPNGAVTRGQMAALLHRALDD